MGEAHRSTACSSSKSERDLLAHYFREMADEMQRDLDASVARLAEFSAAAEKATTPKELLALVPAWTLVNLLHVFPPRPATVPPSAFVPCRGNAGKAKALEAKGWIPVVELTKKGPSRVGFARQISVPLVTEDEAAAALKDPAKIIATYTKYHTNVFGWDLVPQASRLVIRSLRRGDLRQPAALWRRAALRTYTYGVLGRTESKLRRFWTEAVIPLLRNEDPRRYVFPDDGWEPLRERIATCQFLADLLSLSSQRASNEGSPEQLNPISLTEMARRLGYGTKAARTILSDYGLRKIPGSRQLWTVDLDGMPSGIRGKLENVPPKSPKTPTK